MASRDAPLDFDAEPIHGWFELTYAAYLVLPRSLLQSMPQEWQAQFVTCLEELREAFPDVDTKGRYTVHLREKDSPRFRKDPLADYERGRRRIPRRAR